VEGVAVECMDIAIGNTVADTDIELTKGLNPEEHIVQAKKDNSSEAISKKY